MNVLVINAGSSSLKFQVIATDLERIKQNNEELLWRGQVERIGGEAIITVHGRTGFRQKLTAPSRTRHKTNSSGFANAVRGAELRLKSSALARGVVPDLTSWVSMAAKPSKNTTGSPLRREWPTKCEVAFEAGT